jgi:hypothetical protein
MISRIFILTSGGVLCYSYNFLPQQGDVQIDDLVAGFLTAISNWAKELDGGEVRALSFKNFNFIYKRDEKYNLIFVLVCDPEDIEEEVQKKLSLMKKEFIRRYNPLLENFSGCVSDFDEFDDYIEEKIYIPPKILLVGCLGVGKTTILDLFPGETVLELDDDMNEVIQKSIQVDNLDLIKEFIIREIDLEDLVKNSKLYRNLLDSVDIISIVTNSRGSNLGKTKSLLNRLKKKITKPDIYIIANFQDQQSVAFAPEKIEKSFDIQTFGFSAVKNDAKKKILSIFSEMLKKSVLEKKIRKEE